MLHSQIFDLCYYGNGFIYSDVYQMPVHIRNFYYNKLVQSKKTEKEQTERAQKNNGPAKGPNLSKVRVNR
jgi:hypothetical protein